MRWIGFPIRFLLAYTLGMALFLFVAIFFPDDAAGLWRDMWKFTYDGVYVEKDARQRRD